MVVWGREFKISDNRLEKPGIQIYKALYLTTAQRRLRSIIYSIFIIYYTCILKASHINTFKPSLMPFPVSYHREVHLIWLTRVTFRGMHIVRADFCIPNSSLAENETQGWALGDRTSRNHIIEIPNLIRPLDRVCKKMD